MYQESVHAVLDPVPGVVKPDPSSLFVELWGSKSFLNFQELSIVDRQRLASCALIMKVCPKSQKFQGVFLEANQSHDDLGRRALRRHKVQMK